MCMGRRDDQICTDFYLYIRVKCFAYICLIPRVKRETMAWIIHLISANHRYTSMHSSLLIILFACLS